MDYNTAESFAKLAFTKSRKGRRPMRVGKLVGKEALEGLRTKNKSSGYMKKKASDEYDMRKMAHAAGEIFEQMYGVDAGAVAQMQADALHSARLTKEADIRTLLETLCQEVSQEFEDGCKVAGVSPETLMKLSHHAGINAWDLLDSVTTSYDKVKVAVLQQLGKATINLVKKAPKVPKPPSGPLPTGKLSPVPKAQPKPAQRSPQQQSQHNQQMAAKRSRQANHPSVKSAPAARTRTAMKAKKNQATAAKNVQNAEQRLSTLESHKKSTQNMITQLESQVAANPNNQEFAKELAQARGIMAKLDRNVIKARSQLGQGATRPGGIARMEQRAQATAAPQAAPQAPAPQPAAAPASAPAGAEGKSGMPRWVKPLAITGALGYGGAELLNTGMQTAQQPYRPAGY